MSLDVEAAERFVLANARLLDRHRLATLLHGAPVARILDALSAYRNPDGGFGHALEPDVRAPDSEPASTLQALEVLVGIGAVDDPMISGAVAWVASIAGPDGGVPFVLPAAAVYPHAPWMVPSDGGSHLTFAIAAVLWEARSGEPWLQLATDDLDRLQRGQQDDGGWTFDWLAWSPGQAVEWRGAVTVGALRTLRDHGRLEGSASG